MPRCARVSKSCSTTELVPRFYLEDPGFDPGTFFLAWRTTRNGFRSRTMEHRESRCRGLRGAVKKAKEDLPASARAALSRVVADRGHRTQATLEASFVLATPMPTVVSIICQRSAKLPSLEAYHCCGQESTQNSRGQHSHFAARN